MNTLRISADDNGLRRFWIIATYGWLVASFLVPMLIVAKISVAESVLARPPYTPLVRSVTEGTVKDAATGREIQVHDGLFVAATPKNYAYVFTNGLYLATYLNSLKTAAIATLICMVLAFPIASYIARQQPFRRNILLALIVVPFWTSSLIRTYSWMSILRADGPINDLLVWAGLLSHPISMLNTQFAVYVGVVYAYLPFMILPLYATLEKLDRTLFEAAADLGARPWKSFLRVTLPLSVPGLIAGSMLVFIPAVGEYVIPELLGGPQSIMVGRMLWNEFFLNRDWPLASAIAILLFCVVVVPLMILRGRQRTERAQ